MIELLADARRGRYAVCYCESWNLESLQAVVEAAEEEQAPIIVGFNGGFLIHPARSRRENLAYYAALGLALRQSTAPMAFLLNETDDLSQIEQGIDLGFNAVMVESAHLQLDEYRRLVKKVVAIAHARSASVEAQVGQLSDSLHSHGQMTDPVAARAFVEETGIDALSVSIGNVHVLTKGKASIDTAALRKICAAVKIPLVLHGGSGLPPECAEEVIDLGVAKFNFGTVLKQAYLAAVRKKLANYKEPMNPHLFLGMGGQEDILIAGREAVKLKVKEIIRMYGFAGKPRKALTGSTE